MMFDVSVENDARLHGMEVYPHESCGIVRNNRYIRLDNIHPEPTEGFRIETGIRDYQAIIHSHPYAHPCPSKTDMKGQLDTAVPWGIFVCDSENASRVVWFGDECPIVPLKGRTFIHGVWDCYNLVRDYYRLERGGVILKQFPRDDEWWYDEGEDLLCPQNFGDAGFVSIVKEELQVGDVILASIGTQKVNHCAIYMGNGLALHHLYNRLSREEPIGPWIRRCKHFLRYQP